MIHQQTQRSASPAAISRVSAFRASYTDQPMAASGLPEIYSSPRVGSNGELALHGNRLSCEQILAMCIDENKKFVDLDFPHAAESIDGLGQLLLSALCVYRRL